MLPSNVYVVVAESNYVLVFEHADQAEEYERLSGNGPVVKSAVRNREDGEELLADWRDDSEE